MFPPRLNGGKLGAAEAVAPLVEGAAGAGVSDFLANKPPLNKPPPRDGAGVVAVGVAEASAVGLGATDPKSPPVGAATGAIIKKLSIDVCILNSDLTDWMWL